MAWLYRTEAKSIQSWILATDRLRELKGGSSIVASLECDIKHRFGGEPLYAAAGGATLRFQSIEDLRGFAAEWPMTVAQKAPGLEIVQAWVPDTNGAEARRRLHEKLDAERQRRWPDLPEAGPWVARAGRSGLPAVARDQEGALLDAGARARDAAGRADPLGDMLLRHGAVRGRTFEDELLRYPADEGVAIVHADGNAIGERIRDLDVDALAGFAKQLRDASESAAREAVGAWASHDDHDHVLHGRPIVMGGDDFTFLVRGACGIPLAETWLRAFSRLSGVTACAGVAMVRRGFPFARAHELAEALCKSAKRRFRVDRDGGSRLAFFRVTTAEPDAVDDGASWSLSELAALDALTAAAARLRGRGKLRQWLELAAAEDPRAADVWARTREVADADGRWTRFSDALAEAGADPGVDRARAIRFVRGALQWSRIQPSAAGTRLWGSR